MGSLSVFMALGSLSFNVRILFLFCWSISMGYLALERSASWVQLDLSVDMEVLGWAFNY